MGACSSRPKTAEFEETVHIYVQEEMTRKNSYSDQNSECDAGLKGREYPKPTEFQQNLNLYLQNGVARKSFEDSAKRGSNADLKSIEPVQRISSQYSPPNLKPGMENEHGGMGVMLLDSEEQHLAGSNYQHSRKDTRPSFEGNHDSKHNSVAEEESLPPEFSTGVLEMQNNKKSVVQELYEEQAFPQKEDVLGSRENSFLFEGEVVVELPRKIALKDAEDGKFQIIKKVNEGKELPSLKARKPRTDSEEDDPKSGRAILQEPIFLASRVSDVDFTLKKKPAGNLTNCKARNAAPCPAIRAANGFDLLHDKSRDAVLEKPSKPVRPVYGAPEHNLMKNALKGQSAPLTEDSEKTYYNVMVSPSNGELTAKDHREVDYAIPPAPIGLPEVSALSNGSLMVVGKKADEISCIDILPSVLKSTDNNIAEKAHIAASMCDEPPSQSPQFSEVHAKFSGSADENLGVHEIEKPSIGVVNTKVEDDVVAWNMGSEASGMIPSKDGTQFQGPKTGRKVIQKVFVADTNESIMKAALGSQPSSLFKVCREAICSIQGEENKSRQERKLIFCAEVHDSTSREQAFDYERHSTACHSPQKFQVLGSMYGKDTASDIDEVLEKLASEFERQENLSSFVS